MATNQTPKRTRKTGDEFAQLLEAHHDLLGELPPSASRADLLKALLDERKRAEATPPALKPLNVRIPEQLHRQVKTYAFENGLKVQDIVTQALTNHLTGIADS